MNKESSWNSRPAIPLGHRVADEASSAEVAAAVVAVWRDIDTALRPVIGQRGVVALYNRSIHLTAATHPWLAPGRQDLATEFNPSTLEALFAQQTEAAALSCGNGLLQAFRQLLASLIGASLTERLLRSAWGPPIDESPTQGCAS